MDSGDEQEEFSSWRGIPGTIIVINMLHQDVAGVSHAATCSLVKQYLRISGSNSIGICLYGIEEVGTSVLDTKNYKDIFSLTAPILNDFKKLQDFKLNSVTPAKDFVLSDILWHCSKMFANFKKQLLTRTVIMLTKLDIPPVETDQSATLNRVLDLVNSNVDLKVINVSEKIYEIHSFYKDFFNIAYKGTEYELPKPIWRVDEIQKLLYQQSHRHLAVARLNLEIGNGLLIGVGVYNIINRQGYSNYKKLNIDRETNAILTSVNKTMKTVKPDANDVPSTSENGEPKLVPLLKSELLYYQTYGGERVNFSDAEIKTLKNPFGPPMMKLLGFKPATLICKEKWYLKPCQFLFPNESLIEGSTVAFKAMHQACTELKVVAICVLTTRVNSKPKIVALSPCTHPLNLDIEMGFDIINLPYVENVRDLLKEDDEDVPNITDAQKCVMVDIIKKTKFNFKADMFENPEKEMKYRAIEAIALDEDDFETFVDTTKPSSKHFEDLDGDLFIEMFGPFSVKPEKRSAPSRGGPNEKRIKKETLDIDEDLLSERIASNTISKYTVPQLRQLLYSRKDSKLPALNGLKKEDLVNLVNKYYKV